MNLYHFRRDNKQTSHFMFFISIITWNNCLHNNYFPYDFSKFQDFRNSYSNYYFMWNDTIIQESEDLSNQTKNNCFVGLRKHLESQSLLQCAGQFVWSKSTSNIPLCSKNMTWLWEDFQNFLKTLDRICCLNPTLPLRQSWMKPGASCSLITPADEIIVWH